MNPEEFHRDEMRRLRLRFEQGDYAAFMEALRLCIWRGRPLPDWVATQAISNAEAVWEMSTGPGTQGNWRAVRASLQRDERRFDLVNDHLRACRPEGRRHASELALACGYGKPDPKRPSIRIVTKADIYAFVSEELKGTPAQGSPRAVQDSYNKVRKARQYTK